MSEINLNKSKVLTAVEALKQVAEKLEKKEILIDEVDSVHLQVCVKKIPQKEKTVNLKLPHSIRRLNTEVCLFVKDLNKYDRDYEPTVHHFKDFLRKNGINSVTEVIPLKSLKTEYKPYEAKRNLSNAYDIFIADARIVRLLPKYLGKHFYGRKKIPVQVNLQAKDIAKEINAALDNSKCVVSAKGSSSLAVIGNVEMSQADITDNVIAAVSQISTGIGGGAKNIKQLSIKTNRSLSIPIYMSEGGPQDVTIPREDKSVNVDAEEISTLLDAKVKVYPDGRIIVVKDGEEKAPRKRSFRVKKDSKVPKQSLKQAEKGVKQPKRDIKLPKKDLKQPKQSLKQRKQKKIDTQSIKPPQAKKVKKN